MVYSSLQDFHFLLSTMHPVSSSQESPPSSAAGLWDEGPSSLGDAGFGSNSKISKQSEHQV